MFQTHNKNPELSFLIIPEFSLIWPPLEVQLIEEFRRPMSLNNTIYNRHYDKFIPSCLSCTSSLRATTIMEAEMLWEKKENDRKADDNEAQLDKGVEGVVRADC